MVPFTNATKTFPQWSLAQMLPFLTPFNRPVEGIGVTRSWFGENVKKSQLRYDSPNFATTTALVAPIPWYPVYRMYTSERKVESGSATVRTIRLLRMQLRSNTK